jgi:hypothetical protein
MKECLGDKIPATLTVAFEQFIRPSTTLDEKIRACRFCHCFIIIMSMMWARSRNPTMLTSTSETDDEDFYHYVHALLVMSPSSKRRKKAEPV